MIGQVYSSFFEMPVVCKWISTKNLINSWKFCKNYFKKNEKNSKLKTCIGKVKVTKQLLNWYHSHIGKVKKEVKRFHRNNSYVDIAHINRKGQDRKTLIKLIYITLIYLNMKFDENILNQDLWNWVHFRVGNC